MFEFWLKIIKFHFSLNTYLKDIFSKHLTFSHARRSTINTRRSTIIIIGIVAPAIVIAAALIVAAAVIFRSWTG